MITSKSLAAIAQVMKAYGITHMKTIDIELSMGAHSLPPELGPKSVGEPKEEGNGPGDTADIELSDIPHNKENEVLSVLKLSDAELVDKLFPDYTQAGKI